MTYFPRPAFDGDNTHFEVKVLSVSRRGRVRIESVSAAEPFTKTVSAKRLQRQGLIQA